MRIAMITLQFLWERVWEHLGTTEAACSPDATMIASTKNVYFCDTLPMFSWNRKNMMKAPSICDTVFLLPVPLLSSRSHLRMITLSFDGNAD